jgi:hypothetical protein
MLFLSDVAVTGVPFRNRVQTGRNVLFPQGIKYRLILPEKTVIDTIPAAYPAGIRSKRHREF